MNVIPLFYVNNDSQIIVCLDDNHIFYYKSTDDIVSLLKANGVTALSLYKKYIIEDIEFIIDNFTKITNYNKGYNVVDSNGEVCYTDGENYFIVDTNKVERYEVNDKILKLIVNYGTKGYQDLDTVEYKLKDNTLMFHYRGELVVLSNLNDNIIKLY